jgi:hypothetical protein
MPCACSYVICLGILLAGIGCGKGDANRGAIAGQVKLDGQPLEQGSILFMPMEGVKGSIADGEIVNGRFQLLGKNGPAVGWNRVEIRALRKTGKLVPKPFPARGKMVEEQVEAIPPRFNSASTLKVEVKPGENTADFAVESK